LGWGFNPPTLPQFKQCYKRDQYRALQACTADPPADCSGDEGLTVTDSSGDSSLELGVLHHNPRFSALELPLPDSRASEQWRLTCAN